ncbi:hypothetical protein EV421DRAFT_1741265 [Armillaria borealis]|uniref:Uncharacterized protein n=1 Tax=Armillaria borealis TaxID=47425 RepID=A0AA39J0K1_9AGAR|nr:hypothetical protein EV421DRAFT_1741265 [Armillaria borealis]
MYCIEVRVKKRHGPMKPMNYFPRFPKAFLTFAKGENFDIVQVLPFTTWNCINDLAVRLRGNWEPTGLDSEDGQRLCIYHPLPTTEGNPMEEFIVYSINVLLIYTTGLLRVTAYQIDHSSPFKNLPQTFKTSLIGGKRGRIPSPAISDSHQVNEDTLGGPLFLFVPLKEQDPYYIEDDNINKPQVQLRSNLKLATMNLGSQESDCGW